MAEIYLAQPPALGSGEIPGRYAARIDPYPLTPPKPLPWYHDQNKTTLAFGAIVLVIVIMGAFGLI